MRFLTIQFNDGSKVRYSFDAMTDNKAAQQLKLEDFLKGRHLAIQTEGRLTLYPVENIRSLELSSGGASLEGVKLPLHTIRNAKLASS
ncbi:MAG TPA: hypothetical protein VMT02_06310 [Burkholderiales bacterium]|nr:hypothetical protein [Burkholderiales bacterium]